MSVQKIIEELKAEVKQLDQQRDQDLMIINILEGRDHTEPGRPHLIHSKRVFSPESRAKMSRAARRSWRNRVK